MVEEKKKKKKLDKYEREMQRTVAIMIIGVVFIFVMFIGFAFYIVNKFKGGL